MKALGNKVLRACPKRQRKMGGPQAVKAQTGCTGKFLLCSHFGSRGER